MSDDHQNPPSVFGDRIWQLPPLILHPFTNELGPAQLLQGSKAALMLAGLLPDDNTGRDELTRKLLQSRYTEIRMLYFVGKDVSRWTCQCVDLVSRTEELVNSGIKEQSFAGLLVNHPPDSVQEKLKTWGVANPQSVFSRALGINAIFREVPRAEHLTDCFLRHYHRFADHLFASWQSMAGSTEITSTNFKFQIYASGEYSRLLEEQWAD